MLKFPDVHGTSKEARFSSYQWDQNVRPRSNSQLKEKHQGSRNSPS